MHRLSFLLAVFLAASAVFPSHQAGAAPPPVQRLVLQPSAQTIFTVEGIYPRRRGICEFKQPKPLRAKYRGQLTFELTSNGRIRLIDALPFQLYLRGLAEVPNSWPVPALQAQAIAARTYALYSLRHGASLAKQRGYDICSTDQCQVYRGAAIEFGAFGERWVNAVESTKNKVLNYRGRLIQAFFFSTSDGRTRSSFPGGTPQPYLPSVSGEDGDAPLAHWTARVAFSDLEAVLRADGDWTAGAIRSVTQNGDTITVAGDGGSATLTKDQVRNALNTEAPCLFPARYPDRTGSARHEALPQAIPSTTFTLTQQRGVAVFTGRGWGHGVGMSQFGARALAARGHTSASILSHFYGPARITRVSDPGTIRVLAATGLARVRIRVEGPVRVTTGTGSVLASGRSFELTGGSSLTVRRGVGPALAPVLEIGAIASQLDATIGEPVAIAFMTSRPARVTVTLADASGVIRSTPERSLLSGLNQVEVPLLARDGVPLPPGAYTAVVEAYDGLDRVRSVPIAISVTNPVVASPSTTPPVHKKGRNWGLGIGIIAGVVALIAFGVVMRRVRPLTRT